MIRKVKEEETEARKVHRKTGSERQRHQEQRNETEHRTVRDKRTKYERDREKLQTGACTKASRRHILFFQKTMKLQKRGKHIKSVAEHAL